MDTTPEDLVRRLVNREEWPEPSLLAAILDRGEAAKEPLLRFLQRQAERPTRPVAVSVTVAWLLATLRAREAVDGVVKLFRRYDLETLQDELIDILHDLGPASLEGALEMVQDTSLSFVQRTRAMDVAALVARDDPAQADRVKALLRGTLRDILRKGTTTDDDREIATSACYTLIDLRSAEDLELIDEAIDRGVADAYVYDVEDVEEVLAGGGETFLEQRVRKRQPFLREYRENYPDRLRGRGWAGWYESNRGMRLALLESIVSVSGLLSEALGRNTSLGRNAPCWCGSGRKYKYCHWAEDQRRQR